MERPRPSDPSAALYAALDGLPYRRAIAHEALRCDDACVLAGALDRDDALGPDHRSALLRSAILSDAPQCVRTLAERGTPLDHLPFPSDQPEALRDGWDALVDATPLRLAARSGHGRTIAALLDAGLRPTERNAPAVADALLANQWDAARQLAEAGWDPVADYPAPVATGNAPRGVSKRLHGIHHTLTDGPQSLVEPLLASSRSVQDLTDDEIASLPLSSITAARTLLTTFPRGPFARTLHGDGLTLVEREGVNVSSGLRHFLLGYTLIGDLEGDRFATAAATISPATDDRLRLKGLTGLSWTTSGAGIALLRPLAADDRAQALHVLSARFMDGASRRHEPSMRALGELSASAQRLGWV